MEVSNKCEEYTLSTRLFFNGIPLKDHDLHSEYQH